jgi:aryl-alcohol dehydrogenase-like predicted oxidoreductase
MFVARLKPLLRPVIKLLKLRRGQVPATVSGALSQEFSPDYLRRAVEGSLRRLRTDYLDLFQLHSPSAQVVERGDWVPALESLKRAGKIRYYGVSCDAAEAGLAALKYPGVSSLQFTLNLLEQQNAERLLPASRAGGVAVVARECLANGLLAKNAQNIDLGAYVRSPDDRALREEQLAVLRRSALDRGRPLIRLALDYVTGIDGVSVALVGARTLEQLRGVLSALG